VSKANCTDSFARSSYDTSIPSGHMDSVESCKWGGQGLLYSASRDRTIKVWSVEEEGRDLGKLVRTLSGHGHRVNTLALNVDYACRTGPFGHEDATFDSPKEAQQAALVRYNEALPAEGERLVSGSDDFTLFMWAPTESKHSIARLTGHCQPVTHLAFSPNGLYLASASFDKKIKVWDGRTGRFLMTLTGHVGRVYQVRFTTNLVANLFAFSFVSCQPLPQADPCILRTFLQVCWSCDSRLLVSASQDGTVKLWKGHHSSKAEATLPGHADEVYALDWSPNGGKVASGSKDRTIKIWAN
jgi:ribosome assembly protein 4